MRIVNHNVALRLKSEQTSDNVLEVNIVLNQYYNRLYRIRKNQNKNNQTPASITEAHKLEGLYMQRAFLDKLVQNNKLDAHIASQVRENMNYKEFVWASK